MSLPSTSKVISSTDRNIWTNTTRIQERARQMLLNECVYVYFCFCGAGVCLLKYLSALSMLCTVSSIVQKFVTDSP